MSRPQGHSAIGRLFMSMKNPPTLTGIEPATFRTVAQHLNHCATAVPLAHIYIYIYIYRELKLPYVNILNLQNHRKREAQAYYKNSSTQSTLTFKMYKGFCKLMDRVSQ